MRISFLSLSVLASSLASLALSNDDGEEIIHFPITLTWEKGAPDGFERDIIFMNGQFPGPTLEMNQGASVEVRWIELEIPRKADNSSLLWPTTCHLKQQYISMGLSMCKSPLILLGQQLKLFRQLNSPWSGMNQGK